MGKSITLAQLMADVRMDYDIDSASSRVSDADLTRIINRERDEFFLFLLGCNSSYMDATSTLATQAGVGYVSLPARFYQLKSIRLRLDTDRAPQLRAARPDEINYDPVTARAWDDNGALPVYWVAQGLIYFWPIPSGVYSLPISYVEGFSDLSTGQSWDCQPGWDAWVVQRCLMRLHRRSRESEGFQMASAEVERLSGMIMQSMTGLDAASPPMARRLSHYWDRSVRRGIDDRWSQTEDLA